MAKYPIADNEIGSIHPMSGDGVFFVIQEWYKCFNYKQMTYKEFREQYPYECSCTNHRSRLPIKTYTSKKRNQL